MPRSQPDVLWRRSAKGGFTLARGVTEARRTSRSVVQRRVRVGIALGEGPGRHIGDERLVETGHELRPGEVLVAIEKLRVPVGQELANPC
jgi:hypothetical protein